MLDFVLHRFFSGLAEMHMDDIGGLADLFYDSRARDSPKIGKKSLVKEKGKTPETDWKTEYARLTKGYLDYRSLLLEWKECYAPKTPEEEWDRHFVTVLRELSIVEYYLDISSSVMKRIRK